MSNIETPHYNKDAAEFWGNTPEEQAEMDARQVEVDKATDRFASALGAEAMQGAMGAEAELKSSLANVTETINGNPSQPELNSEELWEEPEDRK